jgi:hypothetical protein
MVMQEANNHALMYVVERRQVGARMMSKEQSRGRQGTCRDAGREEEAEARRNTSWPS